MEQTNTTAYGDFRQAYNSGDWQQTMDLSAKVDPAEIGLMDVHRVKSAGEMLQAERESDTRRVIR
jgi:hypothetical protein